MDNKINEFSGLLRRQILPSVSQIISYPSSLPNSQSQTPLIQTNQPTSLTSLLSSTTVRSKTLPSSVTTDLANTTQKLITSTTLSSLQITSSFQNGLEYRVSELENEIVTMSKTNIILVIMTGVIGLMAIASFGLSL